MSFPRKEMRLKCYQSRDDYWNCLDRFNVNENDQEKIPDECKNLQKLFENDCPQQWVQHFNRKYRYLKFKSKIETGYDPIDDGKK